MRRAALVLLLLAAPVMAQQSGSGQRTGPLTRGLADTLYAPLAAPIAATTCSNQFLTAIASSGAGTCSTDTLASAQHANQGTTTTLLHGNAAGNPSWASVVSADLNITTTACSNQFISAISSGGVGTCTTDTLASAQHANQGTATTVLHGAAAGNPSFGAVVSADLNITGTTCTNQAITAISSAAAGTCGASIASLSVPSGGATIVGNSTNNGNLRVGSSSAASTALHVGIGDTSATAAEARIDSGDAGGAYAALGLSRGGANKAYLAVVSQAGNEFVTGSAGNDLVIRSAQKILFSVDNGTTRHGVISPAGSGFNGTNTNDNATAGWPGELISGTTAANTTSLSTGTTVNVGTNTNITLTAGDWDCTGVVNYTYGATTSITNLAGGISTTTGTLPAQDSYFDFETAANVPTASAVATWIVPTVRVSVASSTSVFLVTQATFSISTLKAGGTIRCRRMR